MGLSNSCLPVKLCSIHSSRRRNSIIRSKLEYEELVRNNAIDINRALEDELLLLPGLTRQLARNIVQYRQANNGFKQMNELLQIDGITPRLFKRICREMTLTTLSKSNNEKQLLDLNLASYTELCLIPGLTPKLATKIINHRHRKGMFHSIDELLKIKDIDYILLSTVRCYLTIKHQQTSIPKNQHDSTSNITDTLSRASFLLDTLPPEIQTILTSSTLQRSSSVLYTDDKNKQKILRFASWNLQQLTIDKAQNPGVKEVICRIILLNKFSIIGIQEIESEESLESIINELNHPTIPSIKNLSNYFQGKWRYTISDVTGQKLQGCEHLGFLYDESIGIELKQTSSLQFQAYFTRSPYITIFRIYDQIELVFVNIHLKSNKSDDDNNEQTKDEAKALSVLAQAMKDTFKQKYKVIFGSFNIIPTATDFQALIQCNYSSFITENTDVSLKTPQGTVCIDNIWLSTEAKALNTGNSGVIHDNLTSLWIPTGWSWGGLVSDHCPVWIEFNLS
ncbi:hypothetical protein I4U23_002875 [Adineta vaga]|nr:hypothetical protein I4U23_002875 [Adineta vaga]